MRVFQLNYCCCFNENVNNLINNLREQGFIQNHVWGFPPPIAATVPPKCFVSYMKIVECESVKLILDYKLCTVMKRQNI